MSEKELKKHGTADLMELLLKQSSARTFLNWFQEHPEEMIKFIERVYGISGIYYILGVERGYTSHEVVQAIIEIAPHKKDDIMTAAQQLEQRGEVRGIQKGR